MQSLMHPTDLQWIEHLSLQTRLEQRGHLDLLVDATGLNCAIWAGRLELESPPAECALLAGTPEHALAHMGPILVRADWANTGQRNWASRLLKAHHAKPCYLVVASRWPLEVLALHLAYFTQGVWDHGQKNGLFRFYDPILFGAVIEQFNPEQVKLLNAGIVHWQWLDRDGAVRQVHGHDLAPGACGLPCTPLTLDPFQMTAFSAWSQAERWYRKRRSSSGDYGITRREALVHQAWLAHMAAHREKPDGMTITAYVESWLARNSAYTQRTGLV